jgi:hypothetical protein
MKRIIFLLVAFYLAINQGGYTQDITGGNTPPPQITLESVTKTGDNFIIRYNPHEATDADGDLLTYIFTWTPAGADTLTFTDTNHSGEFMLAVSGFKAHTSYVITGKSFDTKVYTDASNSVTFTIPNNAPAPSSFITTSRVCDSYVMAYTPHEVTDADGDPLVYQFTFTGAGGFLKTFSDFNHTGSFTIFSNELLPHAQLDIAGATLDGFDTVSFTNTAMVFTLNAPPLQITLEAVTKVESNYLFRYSPHPDSDTDFDPITYFITIGSAGFSKSWSDTGHTGTFSIAATEFSAHTLYVVSGKSFDGIDYTNASNTVSFTTPNKPPAIPEILSPENGQTAVAVSREIKFRYRIQAVDTDGDVVESKLYVTGPGLDSVITLPTTLDYILLPQARFKSNETYQATIDSRDGFEVVAGNPVTFKTPNTSGISEMGDSSGWNIYPVPSAGLLFIRAGNPVTEVTDCEILGLDGRIVGRYHFGSASVGTIRQIDLSGLQTGIYLLRIQPVADSKSGTFIKKIVKSAGTL